MNRPDLDAIERNRDECVNGWGERNRAWDHVAELIAYARQLEAENAGQKKDINERLPFLGKMSAGKQLQMVARISELEAQLHAQSEDGET